MKTAREKLDWLKKNGVPWETTLELDSGEHCPFISISKDKHFVFIERAIRGEKVYGNYLLSNIEIVTPPKKTRKLYLWDYKYALDHEAMRSNLFLCESFNDCNGEDSQTLKDACWKRKVESSMIEVDEDGNIVEREL